MNSSSPTQPALRIGSVSYLNAKPLIYGLEQYDNLALHLDVPSRLLDGLQASQLDVALLPIIDFQRMDGLRLIPDAGIGCDGPTLTVRIFSRRPIDQTHTLACDIDSHTSVALARVILAERFNLSPRLIQWTGQPLADDVTLLLIGDKVVCQEPPGYPHQLDLGLAWKELTGRPFVFAAWMARDGVELADLPQRLQSARRDGLAHLDEIIQRYAVPRGWPADVAHRYLAEYLKYDIGPRQIEAIGCFYGLAARHGVIPSPRDLRIHR